MPQRADNKDNLCCALGTMTGAWSGAMMVIMMDAMTSIMMGAMTGMMMVP